MTEAAKPTPDWDVIAAQLRARVLSNREIARQHGVSEGAVRKFKKKHGIEPDLQKQVQEKVRNELVRADVRTAHPGSHTTDREVVDAAAAMQVAVVREHRSAIKNGKEIVDLLMAQLKDAAFNRADLEKTIEEQTKADDDGARRYNTLMKAVAIPTHTSSITNLANALKTFIQLDRQAFNIGDEPPAQEDSLAQLVQHLANKGTRLPIRPEPPKTINNNVEKTNE
jgi:hypothetical protein